MRYEKKKPFEIVHIDVKYAVNLKNHIKYKPTRTRRPQTVGLV